MDSTFIVPKVSDNSLMSSMMSRLTAVEKQLSEAEAKLKEKVGCISAFHPVLHMVFCQERARNTI